MRRVILPPLLVLGAALLALPRAFSDDDLAEKLRVSLGDEVADFWIYDDLEKGFATARETGKPLLVSFRCVP